jgi:myo-inositol-1(or 4)-monophosphatase
MADSPNLAVMIKAAEKAARSLVRDFGEVEKLQISVKGPGDFVSRADRRSEEIIVESLQYDRPEWGILGEEGGEQQGEDSRYRFIIDPLDGTTNFLHGLPYWAINIALEKDGQVIAGVTFDPIRQEMFRVEKGSGTFLNRQRLRVGGRKKLENLIVVLNGSQPQEQPQHDIAFIYQNGCSARIMGSAALDLAYVAAGRCDIAHITANTKPWDVGVGFLMVREAGGTVTGLDLKPPSLDGRGFIASNADLHRAYTGLLGLPK